MNEVNGADEDEEEEEDGEEMGTSTQKKRKVKGQRRRGKPKSEEVLRSMFEAVKDYFERNWFVDDWIGKSSCPLSPPSLNLSFARYIYRYWTAPKPRPGRGLEHQQLDRASIQNI